MTIRFALAGAGYIGRIHAKAIQSLPDASLEALVEYLPEKAATFSREFGIRHVYANIEELLTAGGVDALVIGTPNFLHAPQSIAALQRGVHVLVEKPMAMNATEGEAMLEASQRSGAQLMVAHCWRFDREVNWLRARVDSGALGRIVRTKGYGVHVHWGPAGWFTQHALAGGGALADMGIHAIDTARYLLGDPSPESVYACIGTHYGSYDVDDTGLIVITWAGGAVSCVESGWWQPHSDSPEAATQLYGLQGFGRLFPTLLELPVPHQNELSIIDPGFIHPRPEHCEQPMYDAQMAYFAGCIRRGHTPIPGGLEGLVNMHIIDAAYASARSGQVVPLSPELWS
jgi:predicted dehydrogenase